MPNDPSCQETETPTVIAIDTTGGEERVDNVDNEIDDDMQRKMMEAQVTFLLTALSLSVRAALTQFRYRGDASTYYAAGDALSTNWW